MNGDFLSEHTVAQAITEAGVWIVFSLFRPGGIS